MADSAIKLKPANEQKNFFVIFKITAKLLQNYCKSAAKLLQKCCKITAKMLLTFIKLRSQLFNSFHVAIHPKDPFASNP